MSISNPILQVDITGTPQGWLSAQEAAVIICADNMSWSLGPVAATLRGGWSRMSGRQSILDVPAIIGTRGQSRINTVGQQVALGSSNVKLFARDRLTCAYCGVTGHQSMMTREHIIPRARGGKDCWMNVVTACKSCNTRKGCRTPDEANLQLIYLPYAPNLFEDFILQRGGRRILADQMEFLLSRTPAKSRLREDWNHALIA